MKNLVEAFLDLPTGQGILLIAAAVAIEGALIWLAVRLGYQVGRMESRHSPHITRHFPL